MSQICSLHPLSIIIYFGYMQVSLEELRLHIYMAYGMKVEFPVCRSILWTLQLGPSQGESTQVCILHHRPYPHSTSGAMEINSHSFYP